MNLFFIFFQRREFISAFYWEYSIKKTIPETGLSGTTFKSELDDTNNTENYEYQNNDLKFYFS